MKRVYYQDGPPSIKAGIAGQFNLGKSKPVSENVAALLLGRKDIVFSVARKDIPADDAFDQTALEAAALAQDKVEQEAVTTAKAAELASAGNNDKGGNQ